MIGDVWNEAVMIASNMDMAYLISFCDPGDSRHRCLETHSSLSSKCGGNHPVENVIHNKHH